MGQLSRNPEFASKVLTISAFPTTNIDKAAVYIGQVTTEGASSITVIPINNATAVTFSGLSSGSFLPVLVKEIVSSVDIPEASILLIK